MTRAELLEKEIQKSVELFERVVRLNQKAIENESMVVYSFNFSCGCNGVDFAVYAKTVDGEFTRLNEAKSHYLGETCGKPLEKIEKEIEKEEKLYDTL